jgi:hypothetical protein
MGYLLQNNSAGRPLLFLMIDAADHIAGKASLTPTVTIRKPAGSFAAPAGAVTEVGGAGNGNGWYQVAGNATDTSALGPLLLHASAEGADPTDDRFEVVAFNPDVATNLGLSALPAVAAGAAGGLSTLDASAHLLVYSVSQPTTIQTVQLASLLAELTTPATASELLEFLADKFLLIKEQ